MEEKLLKAQDEIFFAAEKSENSLNLVTDESRELMKYFKQKARQKKVCTKFSNIFRYQTIFRWEEKNKRSFQFQETNER